MVFAGGPWDMTDDGGSDPRVLCTWLPREPQEVAVSSFSGWNTRLSAQGTSVRRMSKWGLGKLTSSGQDEELSWGGWESRWVTSAQSRGGTFS